MKSEPVVKVEPGLKPSPNQESKLDVLHHDDDDDDDDEEMEDENPDGEVGYQDDNRNIEFELPEECYE